MVSEKISKKVLTVGCTYTPPAGGVAQVMSTYSQEVYPTFHCVVNSTDRGKFANVLQAVYGIFKLLWLLTSNKELQIVHIHTASYVSFKRSSLFMYMAKVLGRKVVLHIHGGGFRDFFKTNPRKIKKQLAEADRLITLSESWRKFYMEELHLSNVDVVPNIVQIPQIYDTQKDGKVHLLFLGAINEKKGIYDLLDVICLNKEKWIGKLVLHIGGNQEIKRLLAYIKEHALERIVYYEGWVNGNKKVELLNKMDAFILPSYVEGLPIAILESLSYGKPVIATTVGGIPEVVNDNNGFLFSPGDKKAIFSIVDTIVKNPLVLDEKIRYAKQSVMANSPKKVSEKLESIYHQLLEEER